MRLPMTPFQLEKRERTRLSSARRYLLQSFAEHRPEADTSIAGGVSHRIIRFFGWAR